MGDTEEISAQKARKWGIWFSQACDEAGLNTQQDVAEATGFSRVQIQRWMSGKVRPREDNIAAIAEALKEVRTLNQILKAAGYSPMPGAFDEDTDFAPDTDHDHDYNVDDPAVIAYYNGLPDAVKEDVKEMLEALWKKHQRSQTTHGKKAE